MAEDQKPAQTPEYAFFLHQAPVPRHFVHDRHLDADEAAEAARRAHEAEEVAKAQAAADAVAAKEKERGQRNYVLPDWVDKYLKRVVFVRQICPHLADNPKKIHKEIMARIAQKVDEPITGLPIGNSHFKKAVRMMRRAGKL